MSRSRLFTLTSATSNLCSGLILAFQRHRIWPYHPVRVVFVVSPRAVIECGCGRAVDVGFSQYSDRWDQVFAWCYAASVPTEWVCFKVMRYTSFGAKTFRHILLFLKKRQAKWHQLYRDHSVDCNCTARMAKPTAEAVRYYFTAQACMNKKKNGPNL